MKIKLELVINDSQKFHVNQIIKKYHSYVPNSSSVGRRIDWLIYHDDIKNILGFNVPIGMIGIGSSVYPPPKDLLNEINMNKNEYKNHFNEFANNWRFCLKFYIKNIGTQVLKQVRLNAPIEWKKKYDNELKYLITFVGGNNNGTVYKADNWKMIGYTSGLPNHKSISMKWDNSEELKEKFVKPTGENKKMIFFKKLI